VPTQPVGDAPTAGVTGTAAGPASTAQAPTTAPPTAPPTEAPTAHAISEEFTPSDPEAVNLAAGKPQLVEFFAFW
jgi:hypothetical protein